MFGPLPAGAADLSVDELGEMMRKYGIHACCTLSTVGMLLDYNSGNGATRAACGEQASLLPVATLNPQTVFTDDGPYMRFKSDGFKIVRFFPMEQDWDAAYAPFRALAGRLEAEKLPIMVDVGGSGAATRLVDALARHPAPLILTGIDASAVAEAIAVMRTHSGIYIDTSHLVAVGAIKQVVDCVGAERVLYGSGAPSRPMASALGVLRNADISDDQRAQILGGNARRLLGI